MFWISQYSTRNFSSHPLHSVVDLFLIWEEMGLFPCCSFSSEIERSFLWLDWQGWQLIVAMRQGSIPSCWLYFGAPCRIVGVLPNFALKCYRIRLRRWHLVQGTTSTKWGSGQLGDWLSLSAVQSSRGAGKQGNPIGGWSACSWWWLPQYCWMRVRHLCRIADLGNSPYSCTCI